MGALRAMNTPLTVRSDCDRGLNVCSAVESGISYSIFTTARETDIIYQLTARFTLSIFISREINQMSAHVLKITAPAKETPNTALPDGAITGNGDLTAILAGTADRIKIYIGKADFWKADGRVHVDHPGGIAPLGLVEVLLPQLAYADYRAEQNLDEAYIKLCLDDGKLSAELRITVCAVENTIILALDRTFPAVSASVSLIPLDGCDATAETGKEDGVTYSIRGFDHPEYRFPSYGVCALKRISRTVKDGRERIVWAITAATNHDTAAFRAQAIEHVQMLDSEYCERLLAAHAQWWKDFWSKSEVRLPDKELELYWYAGLYAVACTARNKRFPPGLWGAYSTADSMGWFGDYHLNYNYQAPFYALAGSNHPELLECYMSPINDFLPTARRYASEFLGVRGSFFPVGLGPLGLETDRRPETKEHGHLFHGQKSNGAYTAVIPMMHWYSTRNAEFARREYYEFLLSVADFWEDYLVFEDDKYQIYNDALNEVGWFSGYNYMPCGQDDKNPIVSRGLVRMVMKLLIDLSSELGLAADRIPKWRHILDHLPAADTFDLDGEPILRGKDNRDEMCELALEFIYPVGGVGRYGDPKFLEAARNLHRKMNIWDSHNRFCSYYPEAVRLGCYPPHEIIEHIHEIIEKRGLPNGMFRYGGGGIENCSAIPNTVNEMLLESFEGIIRLFPCWDRSDNASFKGLRAFGAFVIDGSLGESGISARILSEKGRLLRLEKPGEGYTAVTGDKKYVLTEDVTDIPTSPGDVITVTKN